MLNKQFTTPSLFWQKEISRRDKESTEISQRRKNAARYEAYWPRGTKERVRLNVLLYTGLRRSVAVRLGRRHIRNGIATLKSEKSGYKVEVNLPILPPFQAVPAAGPTADLALICSAYGQLPTKDSFSPPPRYLPYRGKMPALRRESKNLRKAFARQQPPARLMPAPPRRS